MTYLRDTFLSIDHNVDRTFTVYAGRRRSTVVQRRTARQHVERAILRQGHDSYPDLINIGMAGPVQPYTAQS